MNDIPRQLQFSIKATLRVGYVERGFEAIGKLDLQKPKSAPPSLYPPRGYRNRQQQIILRPLAPVSGWVSRNLSQLHLEVEQFQHQCRHLGELDSNLQALILEQGQQCTHFTTV